MGQVVSTITPSLHERQGDPGKRTGRVKNWIFFVINVSDVSYYQDEMTYFYSLDFYNITETVREREAKRDE